MATLNVKELQDAVAKAGSTWLVRALPPDEPAHGLGWEPSPPAEIQQAEAVAQVLVRDRLQLASLFQAGGSKMALAAGAPTAPARPSAFDWRSRSVIGPVRNQRYCGSCVSFATTGLVAAQAGIELSTVDLLLSEADQHFCSSHGASCGGWNNAASLNQIKTRGVSTDATFPYMTAFDSPPVLVPAGDPNALWRAYCRTQTQREWHTYRITDVSAWTGDARKTYLATVGPLVCGFKVYEDFDSYGGGVYRHVSGKLRGGHAVLVIGYSDPEQAWICRNSWGTGFGGAARADGTGGGFFKIGYGECSIDDEAFCGCHGVIPPTILPMVTAAARGGDRLDLFAAGADHGTYTAALLPGSAGWQGWSQVQGGVSAPGTFLHAVSRGPNLLDAFTVGTDLGVWTAAWQPGNTNWRGWWRVGNLQTAPNSSVFGVSRSANKLDIFAVGADRGVYTAAWQPGDTTWRGWWRIGNLQVAPNTSVFGVSRSADKLDIFAVGADHKIYTAAWQAGDTAWRGWWPVAGGVAAPNTSVTAVSRSADKLDIFCVGTNQGIWTAAWQAGDANWRGWWPVQGGVAAPNTSVFGVSRSADKLDIFCVGTDFRVYTAAWQPGDTTWRGWWPVATGRVAPGTSPYAVSRGADKLTVLCVTSDYSIASSSWQPGNTSWQAWQKVPGGTVEGS